jgi:hypothetical protein
MIAGNRFEGMSMGMTVEIEELRGAKGVWTVEAIGPDGEIYQTIFAGPDAKRRAEEYARREYALNDRPQHRSA